MHGYYLDFNGEYYEGDKADHRHIEVPQRPSPLHEWDGDGWVLNLTEARNQKLAEIKTAFETALQSGKFFSAALGIEVDCRRSATNNDKQNSEGLLSYMQRNSVSETQYRGYADTVTVTPADLTSLISEMEDHVLSLYQHKWELEGFVETGTTEEELNAIVW